MGPLLFLKTMALRSSASPQLSLIFSATTAFGNQNPRMGIRSSEDGNPILEKSCSEGRMKLASRTKSRAEGSKTFGFAKYFPKTGSKAPRVQLVYRPANYVAKSEISKSVEGALSFLNEKSLSKQGPGYELVDLIGVKKGIFPACYHLNFTAKPKSENGAEEVKLFFAEILDVGTEACVLKCRICRQLGPSGTKTGLFWCKICRNTDHMQHPRSGFRKAFKFPDSVKKRKRY